jgi:hypothetical protein
MMAEESTSIIARYLLQRLLTLTPPNLPEFKTQLQCRYKYIPAQKKEREEMECVYLVG